MGNDINNYANEVFSSWRIGQKNHENGVLLLVSKGDRKLRIEVGYGLEGELTDGESGRIIREVIQYCSAQDLMDNRGLPVLLKTWQSGIKGICFMKFWFWSCKLIIMR